MVRMLAAILGLSLGVTALAEDTESVEFQQRAKALGQSISADNAQRSERCIELRRRAEQTKGPQRRSTARQAFEAECMQDYSAPSASGLSIGN
jgi:hypothetical protein